MDINLVSTQGMCKGVANAINTINKALLDERTKKPIYMLGFLVHNKHIVNDFINKGVIVIEEDKLEALDKIDFGTVIFTAHGVSQEVYNKAISKGLDIIDTTCKDVKKTHYIIKEKINDGYNVIYYGIKNHPESEGVLGINKNIHLYEENDPFPKVTKKTILVNQTTLSYSKVESLYNKVKPLYKNLEIINEICDATYKRQSAAINETKDADICIVVGDTKSNNCNSLKKVVEEENHISVVLVEGLEDIKKIDFSNIKKVAITSGASTPKAVVNQIYDYIKNLG